MKMAVSALLVGASLAASAPASAAEYIQFTLYASGTATTTTSNPSSSTPTIATRAANATVTYVAPLFDYPSFSTYVKTNSQEKSSHTIIGATGTSYVSADANILSFEESLLAHHASQQFTAVVFGESTPQSQSIGNAFPTTSFSVGRGVGRLDTTTGIVQNNVVSETFAGAISRVDVLRFDSDASPFNVVNTVISVSAVPESATWTMMIAGFAAAGAGIRRGKARRRLAPVA